MGFARIPVSAKGILANPTTDCGFAALGSYDGSSLRFAGKFVVGFARIPVSAKGILANPTTVGGFAALGVFYTITYLRLLNLKSPSGNPAA